MKLSFSPISSFCDFLVVTTAVAIASGCPFGAIAFGATPWAIAWGHPVAVFAKTRQQVTQNPIQAPVALDYTVGRVSAGNLAGKDMFELLNKQNLPSEKSDNPPPVPGSPGGSR